LRGTPLEADTRAAMARWLDQHPRGKHGKHEYRLEDYGLTRADVEALFGDYAKRYNLSMD
jgi:hypothetical protein